MSFNPIGESNLTVSTAQREGILRKLIKLWLSECGGLSEARYSKAGNIKVSIT
jgi:hypothetical protein